VIRDRYCESNDPHEEHTNSDGTRCYGMNEDGSVPAGPHVFEVSVRVRLAYADWWGGPYVVEVRASDLQEAVAKASEIRLPGWRNTDPDDEDVE
jgi:hypothetical protein